MKANDSQPTGNRSCDLSPSPTICIEHGSGLILFANKESRSRFGKDLEGKLFAAHFPSVSLDRMIRRTTRGAKFTQVCDIEFIASKGKQRRSALVRAHQPSDDGGIWISIEDVSMFTRDAELHQSYAQMVERQRFSERKRLESFASESPSPVLAFSPDGTLTYANPSAKHLCQQLGIPNIETLLAKEHPGVIDKLTVNKQQPVTCITDHKDKSISWLYYMVLDGSAIHAHGIDITDTQKVQREKERIGRQIEASLREKETLLKEIHHRVKNNLQIVSSLLMMQSHKLTTPAARKVLEESVHRVHSMALIHQLLYGAESLERIDLGQYVSELCTPLRDALAPRARVNLDLAKAEVSVQQAVPVGLIINELLTNAFKYGTPNQPLSSERAIDDGVWDVQVTIKRDNDTVVVIVSDTGPGIPTQELDSTTTLGMQLVYSLCRQVRGALDVESKNGAHFTLTFPAMPPERLFQPMSKTDPG